MPAIVTFDPTNLLIIEISAGGADNVLQGKEIYSEWKDWQLADAQNMGFPPAFEVVQDSDISPGITSVPYFFLRTDLGWRVRPSEEDHYLKIVGNMLAFGGVGSIFVPTLGGFTVHTETQISPQGLTIGSGFTATQVTQLLEIYKRLQLDSTDPWTETPSQMRTASGDIIIDNSGDGISSSTGTRQP